MDVRYDRAPSTALVERLSDGGPLSLLRASWVVAGLPLDLQFREGDEVHLYCGLTRLLAVRRRRDGVRLHAAPTYASQACASDLFRVWQDHEAGLDDALHRYLGGVAVEERWLRREGLVQAAWMALGDPWVTLDREAVLGRSSSAARSVALDATDVRSAHEAIDALAAAKGWRRPAPRKSANEVDQLAVDREGCLVLVELKDARSAELVTAPLQALRYAWEWHVALPAVLPSLRALLEARRRLGLVPAATPNLTGELRVVVAWGAGSPSAEVGRRMLSVKRIVDAHLPSGLAEVEIWSLPAGSPERFA